MIESEKVIKVGAFFFAAAAWFTVANKLMVVYDMAAALFSIS